MECALPEIEAMNSKEQERFVAAMARNMATAHEGAGNVEIRSGAKNLIPGASGFRHQVDVSVHTERDLILYECKYWGGNVDPEAVLALAARGVDIQGAHPNRSVSLNIVVSHDLTVGAQLLAKSFTIRCYVVKSAAQFRVGYKTDWAAAAVENIALTESAHGELHPGP